jgi:hypothetical protein
VKVKALTLSKQFISYGSQYLRFLKAVNFHVGVFLVITSRSLESQHHKWKLLHFKFCKMLHTFTYRTKNKIIRTDSHQECHVN